MVLDFLLTSSVFCAAVGLLPICALSYIVLGLSQKLWLFVVSILYPEVELLRTTTIRTILDTHRNQGIVSVLLSIKGQPQPESVRNHLHDVVRRRDKSGNLIFPRLRHCLVARCGIYAWQRGKFDLDQNLVQAPNSYKGRAITEYNIQDYVSEIVSKYLPTAIPPWQIIIIPSSEDQHYILLKIHHVLLEENVNIGDLLPLATPISTKTTCKSPLVNVLPKPLAILKLKQAIGEDFANFWNEFVANYDPLERVELLKNCTNFVQFQAILLITLAATVKESRRNVGNVKPTLLAKARLVVKTFRNEALKRNLTVGTIFDTLDPRNLVTTTFKVLHKVIFFFLVQFHLTVIREVAALYSCLVNSYCDYHDTVTGTVYKYGPLIYNSLREVVGYLSIVVQAPRTIIEDILLQKEFFHSVTLCGRKSIAWSAPVKIDLIGSISKSIEVSETELVLTSIAACISKYFGHSKHVIPDYLPVTLRNISSNYIFGSGPTIRPSDSVSGILCLNLPMLDPEKEDLSLESLMVQIQDNFKGSLEKQGMSHLLTLAQTKFGFLSKIFPVSVIGVYLRYLSRKYAVSITEVSSRYPNVVQRTLWGQEVSSVIYWRPPQGNSSVSLCLNEYGNHVKLGVMCDSMLVPHHQAFVRGFPEYISELAKLSGVLTHD